MLHSYQQRKDINEDLNRTFSVVLLGSDKTARPQLRILTDREAPRACSLWLNFKQITGGDRPLSVSSRAQAPPRTAP